MRSLIVTTLILAPSVVLFAPPSAGAGADAGSAPLSPTAAPASRLAGDAGLADARAVKDGGAISRIPPDPQPIEERRQWVVELRWEKGDVFLVAERPIDLEAPRVTPRVMGRFALELFAGKTLIERARFDFPGLIDGDFVDAGHADPIRVDRKLTTRIGVLFPRTSCGNRFELWDRATDKRWPLPWPATPRLHPDAGCPR